jgi:hypothetical protein
MAFAGAPQAWAAEATGQQAAEQLESLFKALETAEREEPAEPYDAAAVVAKVGKDPAQLLAWVRDQTSWAPYRGVLRGPTGVLLDRIGSSVDRAMLLAELLKTAGHEARLARANLSADAAKSLLSKVRPVPKFSAEAAAADDQAKIKKYAADFGLNEAELRDSAAKAASESDRVSQGTTRRLDEAAPAVLAAVGEQSGAKGADEAARLNAMRDHWWTQLRQGGNWVDLDPLLPDAQAGKAAVAAQQTLAPTAVAADEWHRVTIRAVVEQSTDGKLAEKEAFSHELRPATLIGTRVTFRNVPLDWPTGEAAPGHGDAAAWRGALLKQKQWVPQLLVGAEAFGKASFDDTGETHSSPKSGGGNPVGGIGVSAGGALGGFGGAFGGGGGGEAKKVLTAEWIEYELRLPGEKPRKIRRQIFDLVGPAARASAKSSGQAIEAPQWNDEQRLDASGRLLDEVDVAIQVCRLPGKFTSHLAARRMLENRKALVDAMRDPNSVSAAQIAKAVPLPGPAYALASQRGRTGDTASDLYFDRPNILTHHQFVATGANDGLALRRAYDVVCNDVGVRPDAGAAAFQVRLRQGVRDTALEAAAVPDGQKSENAIDPFLADLSKGEKWLTIRSAKDESLQNAELPADAKARIAQDLSAGYVVLAPAKAGADAPVRWWRVDPKTGETLGMAGAGWGQAMTEYSTLITQVASHVLCFLQYHSTAGRMLCILVGGGGSIAALASGAAKDMIIYIILTALGHIANAAG